MDVYIGFGLLSAGIVVLVFMIFDGWLKSRNVKMAELSGLRNKTEEPEYNLNSEHQELHEGFIDDIDCVSPSRVIYDSSVKTHDNGLADLCEGDLGSPHIKEETQIDFGDEISMPFMTGQVETESLFPNETTGEIRKPHPQAVAKTNEVLSASTSEDKSLFPPNLLVLSMMAKKDCRFESYDLLQAISSTGMQFGEMNIFHYYQPTPVGKIALFSLASANKPGDFDLNNIAEFSCTGLMLFMDIGEVPDPQFAFKTMLDVAERLAEDLDGSLCADPKTPWNEKLAWQYHQKIMQYKTNYKHEAKAFT